MNLTGVWHHQTSPGVPEYAGGPQQLFAGAEGPVKRQQALLASVRGAAVVSAQVPREGLGGGFGVELGPLGHTQRDHEGALNFDLNVWQGVEELFVGAVLEAERSAVRPAHCEVGLHGRVEEQRVACRQMKRQHSHTVSSHQRFINESKNSLVPHVQQNKVKIVLFFFGHFLS